MFGDVICAWPVIYLSNRKSITITISHASELRYFWIRGRSVRWDGLFMELLDNEYLYLQTKSYI